MIPFDHIPRHARREKGGAPGYAASAPPAPPAMNSVGVQAKEVLTKQQMLQKQGINSTILGSGQGMGAPAPGQGGNPFTVPVGKGNPFVGQGQGTLLGGG